MRTTEIDRKLDTPQEMKPQSPRVPIPADSSFAGISPDMDAIAGIAASALSADRIQFYFIGVVEARGVYEQRI